MGLSETKLGRCGRWLSLPFLGSGVGAGRLFAAPASEGDARLLRLLQLRCCPGPFEPGSGRWAVARCSNTTTRWRNGPDGGRSNNSSHLTLGWRVVSRGTWIAYPQGVQTALYRKLPGSPLRRSLEGEAWRYCRWFDGAGWGCPSSVQWSPSSYGPPVGRAPLQSVVIEGSRWKLASARLPAAQPM